MSPIGGIDQRLAADFVRGHTRLRGVAGVPEVRLHLADDSLAVWEATEADMARGELEPPFWAFAWAGGQALARWLLDHPETVAGRQVLDIATGSGLVAIAAAIAGAASVRAIDIDPVAVVAARLNASANGVRVVTRSCGVDEVNAQPPGALVLAGDVFYQRAMAAEMLASLTRLTEAGCEVLVGDPKRAYLPLDRLTVLAEWDVDVDADLEDAPIKPAVVARLTRRSETASSD